MKKIVYSSEGKFDVGKQLGAAHYSYGFTAERYVSTLRSNGIDVTHIESPEIFKNPSTYKALLGVSCEDVIHLSFRSTENIRIMAGAVNIIFYYWEFPLLKDRHLITDAVTSDQLHMLKLGDELWVSCEFTHRLFDSYGLAPVHTVAPPICSQTRPRRLAFSSALDRLKAVPAIPLTMFSGLTRDLNVISCNQAISSFGDNRRLQSLRDNPGSGNVYLTICNPGDSRKNLLNVIDGFRLATSERDNNVLILKLIVSNDANFRSTVLHDILMPRYNGYSAISDHRILVVVDYLDSGQLDAIYSLADFYVSGSHCEGLNLPLVESMALGVLPISTLNTAMKDYISEENAVIIEEGIYPAPVDHVAGSIAGGIFDMSVASRFDIGRAIRTAAALSPPERQRKVEASWNAIVETYSESVIFDRMQTRLDQVVRKRLVA